MSGLPVVLWTVFSALALGAAVAALFFSRRASLRSSPKRLTAVELELAELREVHEALLESHKRFRSREGMRELRARRKNGNAAPDPYTQPEEWKKHMEAQRAMGALPVKGY